MDYKAGERVLCVRGGWGDVPTGSAHQTRLCPALPRRGAVYTVRAIWRSMRGAECFVLLHELRNPINPVNGEEPVFRAAQFVPIRERETDIGWAHEILRGATGRVQA